MQAKTYRLGSSEMVYAPGVIAWAINGYAFENDRKVLLSLVSETWSLPEATAHRLLSREITYTIEGEAVVLTDSTNAAGSGPVH
ncbi:hypothetical protein V2V90_23400 (plasmid) [Agrobacterium leguminum]|uniref:hypothetical protein n=1 Tax=Agrobacterium leguminum TaxID=2792015 RepID=UPI0030CEC846